MPDQFTNVPTNEVGEILQRHLDAGNISIQVATEPPGTPHAPTCTVTIARAPGESRESSGLAPGSRGVGATAVAVKPITILCIHGVGHAEGDPLFESKWTRPIRDGLRRWNPKARPDIRFVYYDELFDKARLDALTIAAALVKLGGSGLVHGIGDFVGGLFGRPRGFGDIPETLRWTAGMIAQWADDEDLRAATRARVLEAVDKFKPELIFAHSLGSLISYDAFAGPDGRGALAGRTYVTLGSQIANPFVRSTLGGRIVRLQNARRWYHLYNPHDNAFAAEIVLPRPSAGDPDNFEQVNARFDLPGLLDHEAEHYLAHPNTINVVWQNVAGGSVSRGLAKTLRAARITPSKPERRALLVGINEYPDPAIQLEGCVNDVFLMSEVLQECGFAAENIRVVLNERATADGIVERLHWLLDGTEDGQDRVFFYSGHGAQIPGYGVGEKVDHSDECLVAYDFDWSREHAVVDDQFYDFYSQLPYGTSFLAMFDCCHSGGLARDGAMRARGLNPPDDIRHRAMKWDPGLKMWVPRDFQPKKKEFSRKKQKKFFGDSGAMQKLGRAPQLREESDAEYERAKKRYGHKGPFLPVILQACQETELAYEYRHGVTSYGAFTYSLAQIVRRHHGRRKPLSWLELVDLARTRLVDLGYAQRPDLVCPTALKNQPIPWRSRR